VRITDELCRDKAAAVRFMTDDAEVERLIVEEHPDFSRLARRPAFERLTLCERPNRRRRLPIRLIEATVDVDDPCGPTGARDGRVSVDTVRLLPRIRCRGRAPEGAGQHRDSRNQGK